MATGTRASHDRSDGEQIRRRNVPDTKQVLPERGAQIDQHLVDPEELPAVGPGGTLVEPALGYHEQPGEAEAHERTQDRPYERMRQQGQSEEAGCSHCRSGGKRRM
jgi:hypothetical protein